MKIKCIRIDGNEHGEQEVTEKQLAEICIRICGGGYTVEQTMNALAFQRQLLDGESVSTNAYTWSIEK